jgi:hypothetical protein
MIFIFSLQKIKKIKMNFKNNIHFRSAALAFLLVFFAVKFSAGQTNNAFGDNMKVVDSTLVSGNTYQYVFAMYSGDVNQDGAIDGSDFLDLDPSIQNGDGGYMVGDLNGDGAVDGSDFLVLDPNVQLGVGVATP